MGYTKTDHYDGIIRRHIRSGRASNKTEVVHQALALLDAVTRNRGPVGSSFATPDELEALLLDAGPVRPMTAARKARMQWGFETVKWQASPEVDDDLIEGRDFIRGDNDAAARSFLNAAFEAFDLLGDFPEMGPRARLRSKKLRDLRFFVMPPPFSRWIVFYRVTESGVGIARVLHGSMNWRQEPERFF